MCCCVLVKSNLIDPYQACYLTVSVMHLMYHFSRNDLSNLVK